MARTSSAIKTRTIQQRFTQGEFDPLMIGRSDIDQYYGGAEKMRDVFPLPQGGFKRRPGLESRGRQLGALTLETTPTITAPNGGTTANANDNDTATVFTTTTPVGTTNPFVVIQYDLGIAKKIGYVNLRSIALTAGNSSDFYVQVSNDGATWTTKGDALQLVAGGLNYTRRVHGTFRYVRVARIGSTALAANVSIGDMLVFTETGVSKSRIIEFEFNIDQTYIMTVTDQNISVYQNGVYLVDIYIPALTQDKLKALSWEQDADTLLLYHGDLQTIKVQRMGANDQWATGLTTYNNIPTYPFSTAYTGTLTPAAISGASVNVTSSTGIFVAGMVGWGIRPPTGGYGRILSITNATTAVVQIVNNFINTTAFNAAGSLEEPIWSATRGWPRLGCFYQGRLWVDGGRSRPSVVYGSRVNDYFNYDFGTALDDQAIGPLSAGKYNTVTAIYAGRNLLVFTTGGENIIPQSFSDPITPKTAIIAPQTKIGSLPNIRPQEFEGGVLYVQRGGKSIQEMIFDDSQNAFGNNYISLLSSHLVQDPQDFALRRATSTQEGAYLMMVTGDGSLTVVLVLRSQGITSFTKQTTPGGTITNCGADPQDMYVITQRTVNGEQVKFLERFNDDCYMDSSTLFTLSSPQQTFTGLTQLEGMTCRVLADGAVMQNKTVTGGSVTLERSATASAEIGLNFNPLFRDLPVEVPQAGTLLGKKKNLSQVQLQLNETADLTVNGRELSFRGFGPAGGGSPLDMTPPRYTGFKRVMGFLGWDYTGQVEITQKDPLPMTVMAYSKRVSFQRG